MPTMKKSFLCKCCINKRRRSMEKPMWGGVCVHKGQWREYTTNLFKEIHKESHFEGITPTCFEGTYLGILISMVSFAEGQRNSQYRTTSVNSNSLRLFSCFYCEIFPFLYVSLRTYYILGSAISFLGSNRAQAVCVLLRLFPLLRTEHHHFSIVIPI